jgi:hypothetical protein
MIRNLNTAALASLTLFGLLATDHAASAQVVAYDHRSTVLGDHLAGASELVRAQGSFLRDEADAAETWTRVIANRDAIQYQRSEYRFQEQQMYLNYLKAKADANRERQAADAAGDAVAAQRMWRQAQTGGVIWPAALNRPEYVGSMSLIDSLLRNWSPVDANGMVYRRALATEAGVLRTRVASNKNISFNARVEAVRTLRQLQLLANETGMNVPGSQGSQVAMR